ncbi:MAG: alkaline phosphatase family protein [Thermoguttaceae bacterium]|nr:alkaline phosphatase family protein [Thermoguttaceae bacterium]MDW8039297.1 alkaline phosphatase family protein [Thermoguttaceae bacterium]
MKRLVVGMAVLALVGLLGGLFWMPAAWPEEAKKPAREGPPRNIILIGWDGAQRDHVLQCLERGELPTLKRLQQEGALVHIDVITGATDTKAGWTQILTGYHPEVTGVYSNGRFRDVPAGLSVFERLKKHFGQDFACVAVIGKSAHCGEIRPPWKKPLEEVEKQLEKAEAKRKTKLAKEKPETPPQPQAQPNPKPKPKIEGRIVEEDGVQYVVFDGSPYYTMHKSCDVWEYGLMLDEKVGSRAIELLEKYKDKPFFFFVHFAEVDHLGHKHGENSPQYNAALISNDKWTGKIIEKLEQLGLYDKTLIYVTADHGFDEDKTSHSYAPYIFLATNDPLVKRDGMRQDIAPTILARFGVDLSKLEPPLDGEPLTQPATKPVLKAPETKPKAEKPKPKPKAKRKAEPVSP